MTNENIHWIIGIVLLLAIGFFVGTYLAPQEINIYNDETGVNTLSVSSTVTKEIAPDEVEISLAIETLSNSAINSQQDNAKLAESVMGALKLIGVQETQIETSNYNVHEEKQWNRETQKYETQGYKTTNTIKITLSDLSKVGNVIDVAVQNGANRVNGINFTLSEATQKTAKENALQEASQYARTKGNKIAAGLGISIKGIHSITENSYYYTPNYRSYDMMTSKGMENASTPISPEDVSISATIAVQFEI